MYGLITEPKNVSSGVRTLISNSFLSKKEEGSFFDKKKRQRESFFHPSASFSAHGKEALQTKSDINGHDTLFIQTQKQPGETKEGDPPNSLPKTNSPRVKKCYTHPEFPDFDCLGYALKLDIDENLWNNAYHFYRVASLFPGNNELMLETFMRYGLGVNLLETSFGFAGADKTLGKILSYGTGIGLKSYEFLQNGKLQLDLPIPLVKGVSLDLRLDLDADPNNLTNIKKVNTAIGISGHF